MNTAIIGVTAMRVASSCIDMLAGLLPIGIRNTPPGFCAIAGPALVHGHCHQKSFGAFKPVEKTLRLIPELKVETIESSCCGMAGAFGYGADTVDVSLAMAELSLLPAIRKASDAIIVADGTSCRHQIRDGAARKAVHVAKVLAQSLATAKRPPRMGSVLEIRSN